MNIGLIPARGGSKRIPSKNIKLFNGKPIIAYSIEALLASKCVDRVIVSTDSEEIANVALQYGAEVPFVRPAKLADDFATTGAVIEHAINWLYEHNIEPEYMCVLYATAPFCSAEVLQKAYQQLELQRNKKFCFGVTEFSFPIQRAIKISESGDISMFQPEHAMTRSQDLEKAFHDAGQFYWGRTAGFLKSKGMFSEDAIPYVLPSYLVQDIDNESDWVNAQAKYVALKEIGQL